MIPFSCQMVQSVFKFVNILIISETHSFHPAFCSINVGVRPFSWESFEDGRRNLHSGCIIIIWVCILVKVRVWQIPPCVHLHRACWNLHLWPGLACRPASQSASTRFPRRSIGWGGKGSRGWHPHAPPWGGSQGLQGAGASCSLSSPVPHPSASWYSPSSPSVPSSPMQTAFPWSLCLAAVAIMKIYRWGWDLPMQIPKCKYLRASGERVLENVHRLGSTCSVSNGGMWVHNWLCCPFLHVNVCEATGCIAGHLYLCFWLLCNKAVETLEASEAVLVWVWVCSWCEILLLWVPPVLLFSGLSWSVWSTGGSGNSSSSFSETCNSRSIQD